MAARKSKKEKRINLLPQEEFAASTLGRVLAWLMSTFRIIVIVTEVVVMGAFLSRFWLDARAADLTDLIRQRQAIIEASEEFETEFRQTQAKLRIFSNIVTSQEGVSETLTTTSSYLPTDIFLTSFSIGQGSVQIKGVSPTEISIAQLLANLESVEEFQDVALTQVDTSEELGGLLTFTLKISLSKGGS